MKDLAAPAYGLPPCLLVPIAAKSGEAIQVYVGCVVDGTEGSASVSIGASMGVLLSSFGVFKLR